MMSRISLFVIMLSGCSHVAPEYKCNGDRIMTREAVVSGDYDAEWLEETAEKLGLRPVDYLHGVTTGVFDVRGKRK